MKLIFPNTIIIILLFLSCKKETPIITTDPCDNAYDLNSELYGNFYKGSLRRKDCSIVTLIPVFPEKYRYLDFCINPNNDYEICYLKIGNDKMQSFYDCDLYKFDFCTGKNTLLINHVSFVDWSKKDWIIFRKNTNEMWKVKSNGDSLIQLSKQGISQHKVLWSPDGTKYIYNVNKIADENGKLILNLPFNASSITWLNNEEILFEISTASRDTLFDIESYNIKTGNIKTVYKESAGYGYIYKYNPKYDALFVSRKKNGRHKFAKISTSTWKSTELGDYYEGYIPSSFSIINNKKMIYNLILKDTFTNKPCFENQRYHIAIKNLNDTLERRIKFPE